MAYSDKDTLKIFLSYASEDQSTAKSVKLALKTGFSNDIDIVMMSEFVTGQNWRKIIQKSTRACLQLTGERIGIGRGTFCVSDARGIPEISKCLTREWSA